MNLKYSFASLLLTFTTLTVSGKTTLPYKDKNLAPELRAKDLLQRMTLDEKVAQMECSWLLAKIKCSTNGKFDLSKVASMWPNGIGELARIDENLGIKTREEFGSTLTPREAAEQYNNVQRYFVEKTRLGIPVAAHEECLHGHQARYSTNFPVPIAMASSWDTLLFHNVYTAVAKEVRACGGSHVLGPVLDIVRDPRWGRTEETMGEDPYLNSVLGKAMVRALQGTSYMIDKTHVGVTLKHFGVHGAPEGGVNTAPSFVDEHESLSSFFIPFRDVIRECDPLYTMITYNELWGQPAHGNRYLLQNILRDKFGFRGTIVSDYSGISNLHDTDHSEPTLDDAAVRAINAGMQMELPDINSFKNLKQLVESDRVSEEKINDAVYHILLNKFRLGLFDNPYVDAKQAEKIVGCQGHRNLAYKAATESLVLLQNNGDMLPLDKDKIKTIALIGPNADRCILGGYSDIPRDTITPLRAIHERYGNRIKVLYAEGVRLTNINSKSLPGVHLYTAEDNASRIRQAVETARQADVIVLFLGENEAMSREATSAYTLGDLADLSLQAGQKELIDQITALGKPVCAMVNSGTTLSLGYLESKVPAVMQCWYLGQEGGYAMVDALFGTVNPSGKLTISFPRSVGHIPAYYNYKPSSRRGYNLDEDISPLHPFGFGLSYTKYQYGKVSISGRQVSVDVTNSGKRAGDEIVEMYITDDYSTMTRPVKELKDFKRISLQPGETKTVTFDVTDDKLAGYDAQGNWSVEPGSFTIGVGPSSDNLQQVKLTI